MRLNKVIKTEIIENWVAKKWKTKLDTALKTLKSDLVVIFEEENTEGIKVAALHSSIHEYMKVHSYFCVNYQIADLCRFAIDHSLNNLDCKKYANTNRYSASSLTLSTSLKNIQKSATTYNRTADKFREEKSVVESLLASVTTVKKLGDLMPEIEQYLPEKPSQCTQLIDAGAIVKLKTIL